MELRIPKEVIDWLDKVRGEKSRQAFIVSLLVHLKDVQKEREAPESSSKSS